MSEPTRDCLWCLEELEPGVRGWCSPRCRAQFESLFGPVADEDVDGDDVATVPVT